MVVMIILLILCLPLILMLSLFTTTSVVTVVADVPVTGIVLNMDKTEIPVLNLDIGDTIRVDYTITPSGASNKNVEFTFSPVGEDKLAEFEVDGNLLIPKEHGKAMVTVTTVDGGFRDSFVVYVKTNRVTAIDATVANENILVGETTTISTAFTPKNASNQSLIYRIKEGADVVKLTNDKIKGIGIGTAVIEVLSGDKPEIKDEITVTVGSSGVFDFVDDTGYITLEKSEGALDVILNPDLGSFDFDLELSGTHGETYESINPSDVVNLVFDKADGKIKYEFTDSAFIGDIKVLLTVTPDGKEAVTKECHIVRIGKVEIGWDDPGKNHLVFVDESIYIDVNVKPSNADVTFTLTATFSANTDMKGTVESGVTITLEEGVEYFCNGGYMSFTLVENSIVVKALYSEADANDTATSIRVVVTDNSTGESEKLTKKTIAVVTSGS